MWLCVWCTSFGSERTCNPCSRQRLLSADRKTDVGGSQAVVRFSQVSHIECVGHVRIVARSSVVSTFRRVDRLVIVFPCTSRNQTTGIRKIHHLNSSSSFALIVDGSVQSQVGRDRDRSTLFIVSLRRRRLRSTKHIPRVRA